MSLARNNKNTKYIIENLTHQEFINFIFLLLTNLVGVIGITLLISIINNDSLVLTYLTLTTTSIAISSSIIMQLSNTSDRQILDKFLDNMKILLPVAIIIIVYIILSEIVFSFLYNNDATLERYFCRTVFLFFPGFFAVEIIMANIYKFFFYNLDKGKFLKE